MGYILGVCPHCNNVMSMPDDSASVRCPTCQQEVVTAEAAALAGESNPQPNAHPYGRAANYAANGNIPPYDASSGFGAYGGENPSFAPTTPLLGAWKTNVLFTVLGVLACAAVNGFLGGSIDANGEVTGGAMTGVLSLAYIIFTIVYALKIYPSYFSDKPMLDSVEAISFLNTFAGGIIFGLLWNHNLTLKKIGISHIVYVVLIGVIFILAILLVAAGVMYVMGSMA